MGAQDGLVRGAEVLLRWSLNDQPVSPAEFIPVAEATGSILAIGEWVFAQACRVAAQLTDLWQEHAPYVSVNVSHRQLADPGLTDQFARIMAESGAAPERIILELTESTVMSDTPAGLDTISRLAGLGLGIAVDDFGTGYSSLSQLLRLPVSTLKVDREFVDGIQGNTEHYAIVDAVIRMARVLRLKVVAEGVENQGQAQLLREMGSEFLQGFHFHRPLPEAQFSALLEHNRNRPLAPVEPLRYTIYASTASGTLDRRQLVELLHQARRRNAELGLTGCLLYLDGAFIQMLEGSEEALEPVMASIRRDERHHELRDIGSVSAKRLARLDDHAARSDADVLGDHRALGLQQEADGRVDPAQRLVVGLALGDDQPGAVEALAEGRRAEPKRRAHGIAAGVDELGDLIQPGGDGLFTRRVVENGARLNGIAHRDRQGLDQHPIEHRLAGIVGQIQHLVRLLQRPAQFIQIIDWGLGMQHPLERRLQIEGLGHAVVDDVAGDGDAHRRL